ncbi:hypothetical protein MMC28_009552, partial [Mycoblastus sanguinarius]|nr:hypothetical protein [Mycoblastus sanguinarius]
EARLSLAQACFPNDEIICDNGHDQTEVVYIAFTGDEAASGSNVTWAAINFEDFEASITDLANSLRLCVSGYWIHKAASNRQAYRKTYSDAKYAEDPAESIRKKRILFLVQFSNRGQGTISSSHIARADGDVIPARELRKQSLDSKDLFSPQCHTSNYISSSQASLLRLSIDDMQMKTAGACSLAVIFQLCAYIFAVSVIVPSTAPTGTLSDRSQNLTLPIPLNEIPSDPFNLHVPLSDITVRFFAYGPNLPTLDVALCLLQAANGVTFHVGYDAVIPDADYQYTYGVARLTLYTTPSHELTWGLWGTAIRGITLFVTEYEALALTFYIVEDGRVIGGGSFGI